MEGYRSYLGLPEMAHNSRASLFADTFLTQDCQSRAYPFINALTISYYPEEIVGFTQSNNSREGGAVKQSPSMSAERAKSDSRPITLNPLSHPTKSFL